MGTRENSETARLYHNLKPEDVDRLLSTGFVGRHRSKPDGGLASQWDREAHRRFLTTYLGKMTDIVHQQIAEGDWVATRFTREFLRDSGKRGRIDDMHFTRFDGGKIAELWEYFDWKQMDEELP